MTTGLVADRDGRLPRWSVRAVSSIVVALAGFAALAVAMGIGRFAFTPILPMMQADTGLSIAAGGWLASANYLGYLAGSVAAIRVCLAPETAIRSGLLGIGIATLGMGFAPGIALWLAFRALAGIASAWVLIFVSAWCLERLGPVRRPVLASTVFAGVGSGIAAAGVVCLILMRRQAASADAWIVLGTLSLLVTGIIWPVFGLHEGGPSEAREGGERAPRWDGEAVRLILCYGAWGFGYIIPATFLPALARQVVQDPAVFGWAWPIFGAASVAATFAAAGCSRLVGNRRLWALSHVTMAVGVILPVVWPGILPIMCAAFLVGSAFMVATMTGMQEARHVHGAGAKALMAAMTSAFALGQILGPILVNFLGGRSGGLRPGLVAACALLLMSAYALARPRPALHGPGGP
jgi:MFS family permease